MSHDGQGRKAVAIHLPPLAAKVGRAPPKHGNINSRRGRDILVGRGLEMFINTQFVHPTRQFKRRVRRGRLTCEICIPWRNHPESRGTRARGVKYTGAPAHGRKIYIRVPAQPRSSYCRLATASGVTIDHSLRRKPERLLSGTKSLAR